MTNFKFFNHFFASPERIPAKTKTSMIGAGIVHKNKNYITHTTLEHSLLALKTFSFWQTLLLGSFVLALVIGVIINLPLTLTLLIGILTVFYFLDVVFTFFVVLKSLDLPPEIDFDMDELQKIDDKDLPTYSILCPLYKEASVLPQFVENIKKLKYPIEKLEVLLLLEENDEETIDLAKNLNLPSFFKIVIVPDSLPKTKPKACNYGLNLAKGKYVVIYDAEDQPDIWQLKKAYLAFKKLPEQTACLQAKLNYYNPHHNLLTRLFTAEYSLWFDIVLPGFQSINTAIPLGGTSNHFKLTILKKLKGWDPFNVTEDADLGIRLFKFGYKTAIIDSTTLEEANSKIRNWLRQRSRWIKGYFQTYLVHMRNPVSFVREHKGHAFIFQLVIVARTTFMLINPILWAMTILYFAAYQIVGPAIEALYPAPVFYMAVSALVFGNFIYLYNYMIGCAKRGHWPVVKYVFLIPFYWLAVSVAAGVAAIQLFTKPHYWEKTVHGFHLEKLNAAQSKKRVFNLDFWPLNWVIDKTKYILEPIVAGGSILLIVSSFIGNIFDFMYNAYLGRVLIVDDFGLITLVGTFLFIARIPMSALSRAVTYKSAYYLGKHKIAIKEFWQYLRARIFWISAVATILWIVSIPWLKDYFRSDSYIPFLLFTPVWIIGAVSAVDSGFLSGNMKFVELAILAVVFSGSKFIYTYLFVSLGFGQYVYATVSLAMTTTFIIGWYFSLLIKQPKISINKKSLYRFPYKFFVSSVIIKLSEIIFYTSDIILVKHYLSPIEAGQYALISLVGKMIFFIGGLFSQFILPFVSHDEGANVDSSKVFYKLFFASTVVSLATFIGVGLLGYLTTPILFGNKIQPVVYLLPIFGFAMFCFQAGDNIISYHQAKNKMFLSIAGLVLGGLQIILMALFHSNLKEIVLVMSFIGITNFAVMLFFHFTVDKLLASWREFPWLVRRLTGDIKEFISDINKKQQEQVQKGKLRILVYNWRDLRHVWAGGAEVYIHELAKRWVKMGHNVTVFCGNDGKNPKFETIDGVNIIRRGGFYLVYSWAFLYYLFRLRGKFDVIIDSENGIPFFTPLYVRNISKKFLLIHHVHQEVFRKSLKPPFSWFAMFLARNLMPMVYRNTEVITVSPSSKTDILDYGLTSKDPVIIYNGVDLKQCQPGVKSRHPLVLYLGRIKYYKSLPVFISAAAAILKKMPEVEFVIAGDGPDKKPLLDLVIKLGIENSVKFVGKVTDEEKIKLYQKAWVFVNPSLIEGWGITTIEANACGTPVVASNVPGLRDAVHNPHSGFLVPYGNVDAFSKKVLTLIRNKKLRKVMSRDAIAWAKNYSWDKSARDCINFISEHE